MTKIEDIDRDMLRGLADKFHRLSSGQERVPLAQVYEYASRMTGVSIDPWMKDELRTRLAELGRKPDKEDRTILVFSAKKQHGLSGRKRDKSTIDMFAGVHDVPKKKRGVR